MKTPLAWKNITHNKVRTCVALAGVGFAVILIFMQMGFQGAIRKTATQIYDALQFDLMLRSPAYLHLTDARSFPRARLYQASSLPEVERARPFYLGLSEWQAPLHGKRPSSDDSEQDTKDPGGQWRGIIAMGTDPSDPAFKSQDICNKARKLSDPRFAMVDVKSKPEYGPVDKIAFSQQDLNVETALGPSWVRIVDLFELGTGMAANGACLTNPEGYVLACPWQTLDDINFGLIKLDDPAQAEDVQEKLRATFGIPSDSFDPRNMTSVDVVVLTRAEVNEAEERRWVDGTPLGKIFRLGVWVALFVGVAIVYQVLSSDIANMMGEYATLKAMGYGNRYLTSVVLQQSILLALVGYFPCLLISWGLYYLVEIKSGMPMFMTWEIAILVLLLTIGMCVVSGLAALRKLFQADPADLF